MRGQDKRGGTVDLRGVAIRRNAQSVYRMLFVNPAKDSARLAQGYKETTYSFRRLSQAEASKIKPLRLLLIPANKSDSIGGLSKTLPYGKYNESWFRLLNDLKPNDALPRNRRLKVVAA